MRHALAVLALLAAPAGADQAALLHDLGAAGCVIGADAGAEARALADVALADGTGQQQGDWVVLGADICTIRVPDIHSDIGIDDPAVVASVSAMAAPTNFPDEPRGCYLSTNDLGMNLSLTRGWPVQKAYDAAVRFMAAQIVAGEMVFYSDDVLRTPMGFQSLHGECARVTAVDAMRQINAMMLEHFCAVVRVQGQAITCGEGYFPDFMALQGQMVELTGRSDMNAWTGMEMMFLALGAGWVDGAGPKSRGVQRPPLCHYE